MDYRDFMFVVDTQDSTSYPPAESHCPTCARPGVTHTSLYSVRCICSVMNN